MELPQRRTRQYKRWPCELNDKQIKIIRERADMLNTTYAAYTRALIEHGLSCPLFLAETSSESSIQPNEGK